MQNQGLTRDQILQPGAYIALPRSVLADPKLNPAAKLVLAVYIERLGPENRTSWPGPATIGAETGLTRRGIQKAVKELVEANWLAPAGVSDTGTIIYAVTGGSAQCALRTECASAQSSLPLAHNVRYPLRTECATPSAQSAPEVPNTSTEPRTEGKDRNTAADAAGGHEGRQSSGHDPLVLAEGGPTNTFPATDRDTGDEIGEAGEPQDDDERPDEVYSGPLKPWDGTWPRLAVDAGPEQGVSAVAAQKPTDEPSGVAKQPVAARARRERKPRGASKPKQPAMTDELKALACSGVAPMVRYLRFGVAGLADLEADNLPSAQGDWLKHGTASDTLAKWTVSEFAGFYWSKVSEYRAKHGQRLSLPEWGRLVKHIADLKQTRTNEELFTYLSVVTGWFTAIRHLLKSAGRSMFLNEASLRHALIDGVVQQIMSLSHEQQVELWEGTKQALADAA